MITDEEYIYKVIVIGDIGVGKTSIIRRYVHQLFSSHYKSTIGVDFAMKTINRNFESSEICVKLQLWDIAGQERFGNMTRVYYKDSDAVIIVFDVSRCTNFDSIDKWLDDVNEKLRVENPNIPIVLFINKIDIVDEFDFNLVTEYCNTNKINGWYKTSAKNDEGIQDGMNYIVDALLSTNKSKKNIYSPRLSFEGISSPPINQRNCCR